MATSSVRVFHASNHNSYFRFQIYNSELRQWRKLDFEKSLYGPFFPEASRETFGGEAVACNGLLHWVNKRSNIFDYDPYCGTNKYVIISLPNKCCFGTTKPMIGECKGRLRYLERCLEKYVVWELEDYDTDKWRLVEEICLDQTSIRRYGSDHREVCSFSPF